MKKVIIAQIYEAYVDEDEREVNIDKVTEDCKSDFEDNMYLGGLYFTKGDNIIAEKSINIVADGIYYLKTC